MRPQALTRKNALFAGHDDGAEYPYASGRLALISMLEIAV
jgi:hypothetical protein